MTMFEWRFETPDGCAWSVEWMEEAEAWLIDAYADEDDPNRVPCTCPHPEEGLYDALDTVELASGMPIPAHIRDVLLADAAAHLQSEDDRLAWGRIFALQVTRVDEDGAFWMSLAPTWDHDPASPYWHHDNFPLVDCDSSRTPNPSRS